MRLYEFIGIVNARVRERYYISYPPRHVDIWSGVSLRVRCPPLNFSPA